MVKEWLDVKSNVRENTDVLMWFSIDDGFWQKGYVSDGVWFNYLNEPLTEFQLKHLTHFAYVTPLKMTA